MASLPTGSRSKRSNAGTLFAIKGFGSLQNVPNQRPNFADCFLFYSDLTVAPLPGGQTTPAGSWQGFSISPGRFRGSLLYRIQSYSSGASGGTKLMSALTRWRARAARTRLRAPLVTLRHLGLDSSDVFLASYPRSGNTMLRFMLGEALSGLPSTFDQIQQ